MVSCGSDTRLIYADAPCAEVSGAWNFTMQYSTDSVFVMSSSTFTFERTNAYQQTECVWNFQNTGNNNEITIGEQFFKQFYTVFDGQNNQLGFALSTN